MQPQPQPQPTPTSLSLSNLFFTIPLSLQLSHLFFTIPLSLSTLSHLFFTTPSATSPSMASLSFFIGIIGNVISMLVFASPIGTFKRVVKNKSTENYKGLPYITTLLSTSLWTFYGLLKPGGLLIVTVNGAGACLQLIYVTLFLIYAPKDIKAKSLKLVGVLDVAFLGLVIILGLVAVPANVRLTFVGVICAALTICMYAAPLAAMRSVVKTKSVEYMPFFLSFFLFLNASVWAAYSVLVRDYYIGVPNAIGFVLGSAQLIIYLIYKNKSSSETSTEEMEQEGSAHLVKSGIEMQGLDDHDEAQFRNRSLNKGRSLPKPTMSRQYSIQKIMKTISLSSYELQPSLAHENDIEMGGIKGHP